MLSIDAKNWYSASISGIEGNFNIRVNVVAGESNEEEPVGYNVYRDGVKVNETVVKDTKFDDVLTQTGIHSYTVTSIYDQGRISLCVRPHYI